MKTMGERMLDEGEGYGLLARYGIPVPGYRRTSTEEEAVEAARDLEFPVVMKVVSPQVVHKSDAGGVITGIESIDAAREAYRAIHEQVRAAVPDAEITAIMVEEQVPPGVEMLVGGKTDGAFGRVLTVGIGGTLVELLRDVSIRVIDADETELRLMLRELAGYPLLSGFRGSPPKDEDALVDAMGRLQTLFREETGIREFDVNPLVVHEKGVCAVDVRFIVDDTPCHPPEREVVEVDQDLFDPRSIAVVGASAHPNKVGYALLRNLLSFPGEVYPINPHRDEILGRTVYPDLESVPGDVDWVVIAVPAPLVAGVMEEAGEIGAKLALIISSGFGEAGKDGKEREKEIMNIASRYGIRVVGPNCLGVMLPHRQINATFDPVTPRAGHIAFISQSGAIITTVVDWSHVEEIGFSSVVSVGNQADLGFDHYLRMSEQDDQTKAVIMYVEEIRNGKSFMEMVELVSQTKPVVVIKSGRSEKGKKAASSHTGSLAGSWEVYEAAFRQAGALPADSIRTAFQEAELLASEGYPAGRRALVITSAGGFAVLSSDYAEQAGMSLIDIPASLFRELDDILPSAWSHANPVDILGDAGADRFANVFDILIRNQEVWDIVFVIAVPSAVAEPTHVANEIVRLSRNTDKVVIGCVIGGDTMRSAVRILRAHAIPNFPDLEDAFRAAGEILSHRRYRRRALED